MAATWLQKATHCHRTPDVSNEPSQIHSPSRMEDFVCRLPNELLTEIFLHFLPSRIKSGICQSCQDNISKTWWSIPWVCRSWREIALNTPRYWAIPLFTSQELLEAMLIRSHRAPLTINLHQEMLAEDQDAELMFDTALSHLEHIETLVLHCSRTVLARAVKEGGVLVRSAPILRTCSVTCIDSRDEHTVPLMPDYFLAGVAPRLETLHLSGCWIPWISPLLHSSIRVLVFMNTYPAFLEDLSDALGALERMPSLEHFIIYRKNSFQWRSLNRVFQSIYLRPIPLPKLRQCILMTNLEEACGLMDALVIPATAAVTTTVSMPYYPPFLQSTADLAHSIQMRYSHTQPTDAPEAPLRSIRILASVDRDTFRLSAATACQPDAFTDVGPPRRTESTTLAHTSLDAVVSGSLRLAGSVPVTIGTLLRALPLFTVTELVIDFGIYTLTPEWWRVIVECMPALETIVVYGHNAADTLFETLNTTSTAQEADSQPPLPTLRNLALVSLDLAYPPRCTALVRGLRRRARAGVGMHRLCLRECALPQKRILELQIHVRDCILLIDEKTIFPSESQEYTQESEWVVAVEI